MKPLIATVSRTGNTALVAEAMAEVLEADLMDAGDVDAAALEDRPLVGLGSGVYWLRHDPDVLALADRLPADLDVLTITTSGFRCGFLRRFYLRRLRKRLERRGVRVVGQFYSPGHDRFVLFRWMGLSRGRPNDVDLERARDFARSLD